MFELVSMFGCVLYVSLIGDINGAFLLLHWGASPDTTDNHGDTPLLWLLKNKGSATDSSTSELIRLLLRFGADAAHPDEADGNTALHAIAMTKKKVDLRTAFVLYQAVGPSAKLLQNKSGLTPYSVSDLTLSHVFEYLIYVCV